MPIILNCDGIRSHYNNIIMIFYTHNFPSLIRYEESFNARQHDCGPINRIIICRFNSSFPDYYWFSREKSSKQEAINRLLSLSTSLHSNEADDALSTALLCVIIVSK